MNYQSLQKGQQVFFQQESLPMTIQAINQHYAIVTRPMDRKEDKALIKHSGYSSYDKVPEESRIIYAILDFAKEWKGPHNYFFRDYDFSTEEGCEKVLHDITTGEIEMSRRNHIDLHINWNKTAIA